MKLFSGIRAKLFAPRRSYINFEGLEFFLAAELTLLGPTLLLCIVITQMWPLYVMLGIQILGVMLGVMKFTNPEHTPAPCVPTVIRQHKALKPTMTDWKKAA